MLWGHLSSILDSTINLFMAHINPTTVWLLSQKRQASWIHILIRFQPRAHSHSHLHLDHAMPPWTMWLLPGPHYSALDCAWPGFSVQESLTTPVNHAVRDACFLSGIPMFLVNKKWFDIFGTDRHLAFFLLSPVPLGLETTSHMLPLMIPSLHTWSCVWKPNCLKSEGHACFFSGISEDTQILGMR